MSYDKNSSKSINKLLFFMCIDVILDKKSIGNNKEVCKMVSIIIPCYNVEAYIDECINSVCNQDFEDMEIVAIDDGSTDSTGAKLDAWAGKDSRVKVYHTENNGRSVARNIGIEKSKGEYIGFVDSDDSIEQRYVSALYVALVEADADFAQVSQYRNNLETGELKFIPAVKEKTVYDGYVQYAEDVYLDKDKSFFVTGILANAKLYKRKLFDTVRFPADRIIEDCWIFPEVVMQCKKIVALPDCLYFYRQRENSTTRELSSYLVDSKIEAWLRNKNWWTEHKIDGYDRLRTDVERYLCHYIYKSSKYISKEKREWFKSEYKAMARHLIISKHAPFKTKIKYLTFAAPLVVWR